MPDERKSTASTVEPQRLALIQTVLLAATYDQLAEHSGAARSDLILSQAGFSHTEIASATGRESEAVRSTLRRMQKSGTASPQKGRRGG